MDCAPPRWCPAEQPRSEKSVGAWPVKSMPRRRGRWHRAGRRRRSAVTIVCCCPRTARPVCPGAPRGSVGGVVSHPGTDARPSPHVVVVVGATGDLARRKLFPGLFHLWQLGLMPEKFRIIGSSRASVATSEAIRDMVHEAVRAFRGEVEPAAWREFAERLQFVAVSEDEGGELAQAVRAAAKELGPDAQTLFYLAIPPSATESAIRGMLGKFGMAEHGAKVVLEKPLGTDLPSARRLDAALHEVFDERQIYRIDHFLGKEACRTSWRCGSPTDCSSRVRDPPARVLCAGRTCPRNWTSRAGDFMEGTGTFRDMISTHLFQLLKFVALEPPGRLDADSLHHELVKVFRSIRPLDRNRVVFGQYDGYRDEVGVDDASVRRDLRRRGDPGRRLALGRGSLLPAHGQSPCREQANHHTRIPGTTAQDVSRRRRRDLQ